MVYEAVAILLLTLSFGVIACYALLIAFGDNEGKGYTTITHKIAPDTHIFEMPKNFVVDTKYYGGYKECCLCRNGYPAKRTCPISISNQKKANDDTDNPGPDP